jgi:hypothetical protein
VIDAFQINAVLTEEDIPLENTDRNEENNPITECSFGKNKKSAGSMGYLKSNLESFSRKLIDRKA